MSVVSPCGPWLLVAPLGSDDTGDVHLAVRSAGGAMARVHLGRGAEAAAWHARVGALRHPAALPVIAVGEADGRPWLAWEACAEPTLREIVQVAASRGLRLPVPLACLVALDVARWLHHVHTRTDAKGRPLGLGALGLDAGAIHVGLGGAVRVAVPVAPIEGGTAADVGQLATVLAGALLGEAPDPGVERTEAGPEARELRALRVARPDVPAVLDDLLARATAVEPRVRPSSVRELGDGLIAAALRGLDEASVRRELATWVDDLVGERARERAASWLAAGRDALAARRALEDEADRAAQAAAVTRRSRGRLGLAVAVAVIALGAFPWASRADARPEVAPARPGAVLVRSSPAGTVSLDGRPQASGAEVRLDDVTVGRHVLRASAPGHVAQERAVSVVQGGVSRVSFALVPETVEAPVVLTLDSRPTGATVRIDGAPAGRTPTTVRWPAGDGVLRVRFERAGFAPETRTLTGVDPGDRRRVGVILAPPGQSGGDLP